MKTVRIKDKHNMQPVESYEAESIEEKVRRVVNQNEPIEEGAPIIFQERRWCKTGIQHKDRQMGNSYRGNGQSIG